MNADSLEPKYKLGKFLGQGSYGKVYEILNTENNELSAIKQINKIKLVRDNYLQECLKKEIDSMRKMTHKHSVELLDFFETKDNYNLILELCHSDLDEVLQNRKKGFNELELLVIMNQFNSVFFKMRENQIIHRDLKLKNILVK